MVPQTWRGLFTSECRLTSRRKPTRECWSVRSNYHPWSFPANWRWTSWTLSREGRCGASVTITCTGPVTESATSLQSTNVRNRQFLCKIVASRIRELQVDESHSSGTIRVAAPLSLSYQQCKNSMAGCSVKLKPGYFFSNEPGYYKEDDFGVRLENILEVIPADKLVHLDTFLWLRDDCIIIFHNSLLITSS